MHLLGVAHRVNTPRSLAAERSSPPASRANASVEAAQDAAFQDWESSSASVERPNPLFNGHSRLNIPQSLAAECPSPAASPAEAFQEAAHQAWEPSSASAKMHNPLFDGKSADKYSGEDASAALPAGQFNTEVADTTAIIQRLQQKLVIAEWEVSKLPELDDYVSYRLPVASANLRVQWCVIPSSAVLVL